MLNHLETWNVKQAMDADDRASHIESELHLTSLALENIEIGLKKSTITQESADEKQAQIRQQIDLIKNSPDHKVWLSYYHLMVLRSILHDETNV